MAKRSSIVRELKREKLIARYSGPRKKIKAELAVLYKDAGVNFNEIQQLQQKLQRLPRNSSPVRHRTRCQNVRSNSITSKKITAKHICGRPRAVYSKFSLCRICIRELMQNGDLAGLRKSSW